MGSSYGLASGILLRSSGWLHFTDPPSQAGLFWSLFHIESYCGRYSTAYALGLEMEGLDRINRLVLEARSVDSNQAQAEKVAGSAETCLGALLR